MGCDRGGGRRGTEIKEVVLQPCQGMAQSEESQLEEQQEEHIREKLTSF